MSRGFLSLHHAADASAPTPPVPGEPLRATLRLNAVVQRIEAGHRLVLRLGTTCWPLLWPLSQAVTLRLAPGRSALRRPVRQPTEDDARPLPPPPPDGLPPVTTLREGRLERETTTDPETGVVRHRVLIDGGIFGPVGLIRLEDTGAELGAVIEISTRSTRTTPCPPAASSSRPTSSAAATGARPRARAPR